MTDRWPVRVMPLRLFRVHGRSMLPTLTSGDLLLGRLGPRGARPGAVVVVRLPGGRPLAVKRLVGRHDGGWWVERDNPSEGVDSWTLGAVPDEGLVAVVVARVWPLPGWRLSLPRRPAR